MTDEEKAEEYANACRGKIKDIHWQDVKYAVLYGLAEGRKEKCLEQNNDGTIRPCEVMKENAELKKENEQLKQQVKEYLEMPCTACCITESLESDLTDLTYQFVDMEAKTKVIEKENSIFKSIISTILDKEDICYICKMKDQVLPECMRMENSECLKNMISLWSK